MNRYEIERAAMSADLPGPSKSIVLVLCTRIWRAEGIIPPGRQPSLSQLARESGWDRSTVMRHLNALESAGWVIRIRPPKWLARTEHATTAYAMRIPDGYPQARRTRRAGLAAQEAGAGRSAERELAARDDAARRAALPDPDRSGEQESSAPPGAGDDIGLAQIAAEEVTAVTGRAITAAAAAEVVRLVLAGRDVRNPAAYLREAIRREPLRFLPAAAGPPTLAERNEELRRIKEAEADG